MQGKYKWAFWSVDIHLSAVTNCTMRCIFKVLFTVKDKVFFSFHVVIFGLKSTLLLAQLIQNEQSFQVIFCLFICKSTWQSTCQVTFVG